MNYDLLRIADKVNRMAGPRMQLRYRELHVAINHGQASADDHVELQVIVWKTLMSEGGEYLTQKQSYSE